MALKGDTTQISLTNILQTLQLTTQEGVMTVTSGKARRKVRVLPGGLRLLALNRYNLDVLRIALVKQKLVTESQFQNIMSTMGSTVYPGDFLIKRRILTREQVDNEVAKQIGELIYEIFSWKKAKYEFNAGGLGEELELFAPEGLGQNLIFNINSVLMEAARRDDEWQRTRQVVPSEREIFRPVKPDEFLRPRAYESEIDDRAIQEVKELIDGEHSVESMVNLSTLSSFEVFRTVAMLLTQKEIRPLSLKEKKELAEDLRKKFKTSEVIEIYRNLLAGDPHDLETRLKLVPLLEKRKDGPLLIEQYQSLADYFCGTYEFPQARRYLDLILGVIDPHNIAALEKLFEVSYLEKNHKDALETARKLVDAVKVKKDFARGAQILLKVVDLYPTETFLFHELADFFILSNQVENAVACLKSVAALYEERGDLTKLRKTYERISSLDSSEAPTLRKIAEAERRTVKISRRKPRLGINSRALIWAALIGLVALGVGYLTILEVRSRKAYAATRGEVVAATERGDYGRAKEILKELARRFPISTLPARISGEVNELTSRENERDAHRRRIEERENIEFGSFLARIESLMSGKRYLEALALAREANQSGLTEANRRKLAMIQVEIQKYFAAADELLQKGRAEIQGGGHEEGHRHFVQLMMNYPNTPASQGLKLPLLVVSTPPGARVTLNGEVLGGTPLTVWYDPLSRFHLSVTREGFRSVVLGEEGDRRPLDFIKDWKLVIRLERIPAWVFDAKAPVECTPLVLRNRVYFGTRGGKIFCLELTTSREHWSYSVPDGWDVASGLRAYKDRIGFGTFDGAFHVLDADDGRPLHRLVPFSPPRPIRHPASEPTESGMLALNCGGAAVAGLSVASGAHVWTFRPEAEALGPPELHRGVILQATQDGAVHLLDPETGAVHRRVPLGARIEASGRALNGAYLVADAAGRIRRVDLETGQVQWTYESPMENLTSPAIGGEMVFFGSRGGLIAALDTRTGDLKWRGKVNDGLFTPATWHRGHFYLGTKAGQGHCLEAHSGALVWTFPAGGPCDASPGAGGNIILFPCDDHRVYAFEEN